MVYTLQAVIGPGHHRHSVILMATMIVDIAAFVVSIIL